MYIFSACFPIFFFPPLCCYCYYFTFREEFYNNATDDVYKEGEILKRPNLGITLSEIANKGADVLYTGDLHEAFVKDIQNCGIIF